MNPGAGTTTGAPPLLELRGVVVAFDGVPVLDGVSLRVCPGERVALVGPSGAGKSTLLGVCNATVPISGGTAVFDGAPVIDTDAWHRSRGRRVATIHQQLNLTRRLTVVHNVNAGRLGSWSTARALWSLLSPRETGEARAVLDRLGIGDKLHQRTDRLSGGEQQRVAIARALRQDPALLLADEPTASLDPARAAEIMRLLGDLAAEDGRALLVSQHDVALARRTCDRIVGLRGGRVVVDTPVDAFDDQAAAEVYGDPAGEPR